MSVILSKPLIVPVFGTGLIDLYTPTSPNPSGPTFDPMSVGVPVLINEYQVNLQNSLNTPRANRESELLQASRG